MLSRWWDDGPEGGCVADMVKGGYYDYGDLV